MIRRMEMNLRIKRGYQKSGRPIRPAQHGLLGRAGESGAALCLANREMWRTAALGAVWNDSSSLLLFRGSGVWRGRGVRGGAAIKRHLSLTPLLPLTDPAPSSFIITPSPHANDTARFGAGGQLERGFETRDHGEGARGADRLQRIPLKDTVREFRQAPLMLMDSIFSVPLGWGSSGSRRPSVPIPPGQEGERDHTPGRFQKSPSARAEGLSLKAEQMSTFNSSPAIEKTFW
ncbi:hypothetical protein SKAU_G00304630 [Synaphobranchus kaupii]|uniref:Uncharacterized protein n=1 Tax=Synaphobranchus kaupii TaxID=118154 RepID=A0A9Q1ILH1_SYNKA|nr:hypothetical protein SKAU_G00304630 [Synaphobranchus kaupii]